MRHQSLVREALAEFRRIYPDPMVGRAHRAFVGRDEIAVIETRPRAGEDRRFLVDVISRTGLPSRYHYALAGDGEPERVPEE
ncbi:MAG: hypothetical protein AB7O49_15660 [Sphingomonadales bacterium]